MTRWILSLALLFMTACADPSDLDEGEDGAGWYSAVEGCPLEPWAAEDYYAIAYQFDSRPLVVEVWVCDADGEGSDVNRDLVGACYDQQFALTENSTLLIPAEVCDSDALTESVTISWTYGT